MGDSPAIDYDIPTSAVDLLTLATTATGDDREQILIALAQRVGPRHLARLFAQFIGLANSVVANNREMLELHLITELHEHPHTAEKIHLPTVAAALEGIKLAQDVDASKVCHGCAYRLGSVANQSPIATADAAHCAEPGELAFHCHADLDENMQPTKVCVGWAQKRGHRNRAYRAAAGEAAAETPASPGSEDC